MDHSSIDDEIEQDISEDNNQLTDWENEPTIRDLKQDFTDAQSDHDTHVGKVDTWLDNLNIEGAAKVKKVVGKSAIVPKLIRKQAEWRYAALTEPFLSTDDIYNIAPVTYEDRNAAKQNELVLNNQFNTKLDKIKFIDEYVRTAVDEGTVIVRVGWEFTEEEKEVETQQYNYIPSVDPNFASFLEQINNLAQTNPQAFASQVPPQMQEALKRTLASGQNMQPIPGEVVTELKTVTTKNQPTLDICSYKNITIDPSCEGDLQKAGFIIYSFETSLSELEKDGKYHNLDNINVDNNSVLAEPDHTSVDNSSFSFSDKPRKKLVAYEYWGYWDIDNSGIVSPIISTWVGDVMIRMEKNPFPDQELPFVSSQYLPVRKSVYGEPDGELLEDNQKVVGAVTRGMIDIMGRSANGQMGSRKDALDVTNKRKFDKGLDYEFNAQIDPKNAFYMHTFPEIPRSAEYMINMQNAEAESLTGVKAFSQGITGVALGNTVGGQKNALDATAKRELGILRRLAEGMKQVGRKIISMNGEFLEEEEVVRVTNEEFIPVRRDDLAGKFDLTLTISTAEADNQKAEELAFMLQTMGNSMDADMSKMILSDIARLRKMPDLAKKIEEFTPQPDPLVQRKMELEIELLEAQVGKENSMAFENQANAQLYQAQIRTEFARARKLGSDADKTDLDFVEQESGTTQERVLQKMNTQTEGNIALKVIEKNLDKANKEKEANQKKPTVAKV